jgi:hypothetical protein
MEAAVVKVEADAACKQNGKAARMPSRIIDKRF